MSATAMRWTGVRHGYVPGKDAMIGTQGRQREEGEA